MTTLTDRLSEASVLRVGALAPATNVLDETGATVALETTWAKQPVLLTFLRHYG